MFTLSFLRKSRRSTTWLHDLVTQKYFSAATGAGLRLPQSGTSLGSYRISHYFKKEYVNEHLRNIYLLMKYEKEFLDEYLLHEIELYKEFLKENPDKSTKNQFPPLERFPKIHHPYSMAIIGKQAPIWPQILCTGSLIIPLVPQKDEKNFKETYGFSHKEIDDIIQFSKETGRIHFILLAEPHEYQNLQFLQPIFQDLQPPLAIDPYAHLSEKRQKSRIEIETIIELNEELFFRIWNANQVERSANLDLFHKRSFVSTYADLRDLGFNEIADEIFNNLLINPLAACGLSNISQAFITHPMSDTFHCQAAINYERAVYAKKILGSNFVGGEVNYFPCEIGAFLLKKKSFNPKSFEETQKAIDIYSENQFYQVYCAFNEAVALKNYSILDAKIINLNEIFSQIWDNAECVNSCKELIKKPIDFSIAGIGLSIATLSNRGIIPWDQGFLFGLGLLAANNLVGNYVRNDVPEYLSRIIEKPYNVTIYDFKHKQV